MTNGTTVKEFILLGLTDDYSLSILIFLLLFITYLLTILGNLVIIVITLVDQHLHTPMYFFLRHVAVVEIGYTTNIIPKALANIAMGHKTISISGCFAQTYLCFSFGTTGLFLLAVMSIDRYVAISNPLRYSTIMNGRICSLLVLSCWVVGFLLILGPAVALFQMPFCGPNIINHFFCDSGPLRKLVCSDTSLLELVSFLSAILTVVGTLAIHLMSYGQIIFSVMHISSTSGRQKAFSTCSSHLTVVSVTYGSSIFLYVKLKGTSRLEFNKSVGVVNAILSPLLIPFLYCLRNKQVKDALLGAFKQGVVLCKNAK